jgi:hypothetical protein
MSTEIYIYINNIITINKIYYDLSKVDLREYQGDDWVPFERIESSFSKEVLSSKQTGRKAYS